MKWNILHESRGRIRLHLNKPRLSMAEADQLQAYLADLPGVRVAVVYERTCDAVITYTGARTDVLHGAAAFRFDVQALTEVSANSPRAVNHEYQEKLVNLTLFHFARKLFLQSKYAGEAAGAACVLGHMYPALMHFRGGKGLACLGGVILAFGVHDFLTTLFLESVLLMATRYLCLVPITGSIFYPIYHGIERGDWRAAAILGLITLPILSKHIENLERIKQGKELKLDFLWDKDGELDRIGYVESEF